ncbi:MAG: hypothetical protein Q9184_007813, partial [Pyrenodesmia sp. 2 TL-2023]
MTSTPGGANTSMKENKDETIMGPEKKTTQTKPSWRTMFGTSKPTRTSPVVSDIPSDGYVDAKMKPKKWSMGILSDKETDEIP